MDRATTERTLEMVQRHVAEGERIIERQRRLIARMDTLGRDVSRSEELLRSFEESQRLHIADRDRLIQELDTSTPRSRW
jgi:hypothetical protein